MRRVSVHLSFHLSGLLFLLLFFANTASATTFTVPTDDEMIIGARAIVRGKVVAMETGSENDRIYTYVTVRVIQVLKGAITERKIVVKEEGGQYQGSGTLIFGGPEFSIDEHVLLYLDTRSDGSLRVHQMFLGKFSVLTDPSTGQETVSRTFPETGVTMLSAHRAHRGQITHTMELNSYIGMVADRLAANWSQSRRFLRQYYSGVPILARPAEYLRKAKTFEPQWTYIHSAHPRWFEPDTPGQTVVFNVNPDGAPSGTIMNDIAAAMNVWSTIGGCGMRVSNGGSTGSCTPSISENVIVFNGCDGRWSPTPGCSSVLALGGLGWNSGQTKVVNGVTFVRARAGFVSFNPYAACEFGAACNVQEITTHELGHALGLGHSALSDPTMYGFAHFDGRCAGLRQDDRDGMTFIYPSSTQTWTLTIRSANPASGVSITVSPNDVNGMGNGTTQFTRTYNDTTVVSLTAPSTAGGHPFVKWLRNGIDDTTNLSTSVTMLSNVIMTAVYRGRPVKFDIDGDQKGDLGFYRNGLWGMLKSTQSYSFGAAQFASWGGSGLPPLTGDFDMDAKADLIHIVPPASGQSAAFAILKSSTNYDFGQALFFPAGFPSLGDTPVIGDFDGDGKADPGIWRATTAVWIIPLSSTNYSSFLFTQWGANGDVPIVGDFDLDGKDDIGFYRNGLWGVLKSSQSYSFGAAQFFSWGGAGMAPITGDFDGDGKCDIGHVVPPAGGQSAVFAILKSSTNYDFGQGLFVPAGFPSLGDTPLVSDFDGDGKSDPGVWRSSAGIWLIPLSSTNYASVFVTQWGQTGDTAIPNIPSQP